MKFDIEARIKSCLEICPVCGAYCVREHSFNGANVEEQSIKCFSCKENWGSVLGIIRTLLDNMEYDFDENKETNS